MLFDIVGRRETGKTTLAYDIACRHGLRALYDPRGEFHTSERHDFLLLEDATREETIVMPSVDARSEFAHFCWTVRQWIETTTPDLPRSIVFDECRFYKRELETDPNFNWLIRCTRRDQVNIILTSHRPGDVVPDVRAIVDVWCVFRTVQEHDLKVFEDRCGEAFANDVRSLTGRQFMKWDDSSGEAIPYPNQEVWYRSLRPAVPVDYDAIEGATLR